MTSKTRSTGTLQNLLGWRKRATYPVGVSQRKRQRQLSQQISMLYIVLGVTIVAGIIFIAINWQNAGSAKSVGCDQYPQYCVPLAGGASDSAYSVFETANSREIDEDNNAADGVVRGMTSENIPFIGDPNAPIHFRVVSNYACSHCNTYHTGDLEPFIEDYVTAGKASLEFVINTTSASPVYSEVASQAAFCAGEQGAFWEMTDELYRIARAYGSAGFTTGQIGVSADTMGLDRGELVECVASGKYLPLIRSHSIIQQDLGVSGTPAMFVRYEGQANWTKLEGGFRVYDYIAQLTDDANAQ